MKKLFDWSIFLILLLQIPLILPFFHKGFFPSHDNVQVVRVFEMYQSLRFGDIPPRWSANLLFGRGYPLYVFYAPLPFYIGALLAFIKTNFLLATKAVFVLSFFMGGLGIYFLTKEWWGKLPALVAAIAFSYAPYRAIDVYVRGNLAEFFSFSLFPWVLWLNLKVLTTPANGRKKWEALFILFLFFQEISHNISCFIFFFFLLIFNIFYLLFLRRKDYEELVFVLGRALCLSLLMSAFFWIPLLYESRFVLIGKFINSPYQDYFLTLKKIWDAPWGWGGYVDPAGALSLRLGKSLIISSLLAVVLNLFTKNIFKKLFNFLFFSLAFFLFLELRESDFIWKYFAFLHFLQFPWRFHILTTMMMALLSGGAVFLVTSRWCQNKKRPWLSIVVALLLSFFFIKENVAFFKPRLYWDAPAAAETTTWDDEYLPKWVKVKPKDYTGEKIKFVEGKGVISEIEWGYLTKRFTVDNQTEGSIIEIAHVYYPGWQVYIDGRKENISYDNDFGLMRASLLKGKNQVAFLFQRTPWRFASELVSIMGVILFIVFTFKLPLFKK